MSCAVTSIDHSFNDCSYAVPRRRAHLSLTDGTQPPRGDSRADEAQTRLHGAFRITFDGHRARAETTIKIELNLKLAGRHPERGDLRASTCSRRRQLSRKYSAIYVLTIVQRQPKCSRSVADRVTRPMPPLAGRDGPSLARRPAEMPIGASPPRNVPHFGAPSRQRTANKRSKGPIAAVAIGPLTCTSW